MDRPVSGTTQNRWLAKNLGRGLRPTVYPKTVAAPSALYLITPGGSIF